MLKVIFVTTLFFGIPSFVSAQVIINEIAWMGSPIKGVEKRQEWRYEWLELHNLADAPVRLHGWSVGLYREDLDFEVFLQGTIAAQGYFLVASSDRIGNADVNYGSLAGKFANSGQKIVLKNASGEIAEELDAREGWFGGDNDTKLTMERRFPDRDATDPENWGSSLRTGGTPKAENSLLGKERFLALDQNFLESQTGSPLPKKGPIWASVLQVITNIVFMRAFLVALLFAALILLLRRYLLAPR